MDGSSRAACLFATSSVPGSKYFYFNNLEDRSAISSSLHLLSVSFNLDPKSSMAARQLGSLVLRFRARSSLLQESSCHSRFNLSRRWIQTTPNPEITKECENNTKDNSRPLNDVTADSSHENKSNSPSVNFSDLSSLKISPRHDLAMIFTCKVCETRSVKTVCRESYEKGVVVARCGGCNNLHLMADHLGWFGKPGSVEDFLAARGEEVRRGSLDSLNLTL